MYRADKKNWAPRIGLAWDVTGDGKTAIRAGYGLFYDQNISAVTSQSRNVYPHLIPLNSSGFGIPLTGTFLLSRQWLFLVNAPHQQIGTVNTVGVPAEYFGLFLGTQANQGKQGLAFTLPTVTMKTPSAQQWHLTFEREIVQDTLLAVAYVGSRGSHLTRFRMPNGGIFGQPQFGIFSDLIGPGGLKILAAQTQSPASRVHTGLGPYSIFENSASSSYRALQVSAVRRYAKGFQFTGAYTWSDAKDEVSDVFSNIGFQALPQDDNDLRAERGPSNFDVRHRFVGSFSWDLPLARNHAFFGGWRASAWITLQSGQPYTVYSSRDVNNDGVLTDRLNTLQGISMSDSGPVMFTPPAATDALLAAPGQDGQVSRNALRARGIRNVDVALLKSFRFAEEKNLEFRVELFNLFNRTHYGIPASIVEAPAFGRAINTVIEARQVQFVLKFIF